jgi:UDP-glucuronate decarboxylase
VAPRVARIFNTYGPKMLPNDGRVVSNFIVSALQNKDVTIFGDGTQSRSFCLVDDLIDAIVSLMRTPDEFTGPVNLGNPDEFTISELAEMVVEMTNSSAKIVYHPLPDDDPKQRRPDIGLSKKHLNWSPKTKLRDGLAKTIPYFQKLLGQA